jgi:hypothetical protein
MADSCGKPTRRRKTWLAGLALAALAVALATLLLTAWPPGVPLQPGPDRASGEGQGALPVGSVVATVGSAAAVEAPFAVVASAASPAGFALSLPEGQGDKARNAGRGVITLQLPATGRYRLWLRCRWSDSCGNSMGVALDALEPVTVGQDALYQLWHWVDAGEADLAAGPHTITVHEREDGVAIDQVLACPAAAEFLPVGSILAGNRQGAGLRRFADHFDRSPGHGTEGWRFEAGDWQVAFSLDPNRIPQQYALNGTPPAGQWGVAALSGTPWRGAALGVSFRCDRPEAAIGVLFRSPGGGTAVVAGVGQTSLPALAGVTVLPVRDVVVEAGQWYRLEVERWAWTLVVRLDGREVGRLDGLPTADCGIPALLASGGAAVFDDVMVEEIRWLADDGGDFRAEWTPRGEARWYRPRSSDANWALAARQGAIRLEAAEGLTIGEITVAGAGRDGAVALRVPGYTATLRDGVTVFTAAASPAAPPVLQAGGRCRLRRIALRIQSPPADEAFLMGPYHFTEARVADPADYLDFTPEEYRQIATSPDAERLRRQAKFLALVGSSTDYAVWEQDSGNWLVADGILRGSGPGATLRFCQALNGPFSLTLRVRLADAESAGRLLLGEMGGKGTELRLVPGTAGVTPLPATGNRRRKWLPPAPVAPVIRVAAAVATLPPGDWHALEVELADHAVRWRLDEGPTQEAVAERGHGGGVLLTVERGSLEFDDIVFALPRRAADEGRRSRLAAFDQRETDWWRRGAWLDHGGIACALASNWISLDAAAEEGMLVQKESFPGALLVAFNVEENTEWLGWDRNPDHEHRPCDNICVVLAVDAGLAQGYRLEVNSRERSMTVLYRNGVEVAAAKQDSTFPIQYVGGHAPCRPRRNRIVLVRQGGELQAIVNGVAVLSYRDPEPLSASVVAVGGYRTRFNVSNLLVRELQ